MPNYNPYEQQRLEGLIPAMRQGLDPAVAYDIFSGVESGALQRMAENRAARQTAFQGAAGQLQEAAVGGLPQAGAMDLVRSYQAQMPGLGKGQYAGRLEDLVKGGLYQGPGPTSSLYVPEATEAAGAITPQDVMDTIADAEGQAAQAAQRQQAMRAGAADPTFDPLSLDPGPTSLHDLRVSIMSRMRGVLPESALAQLYDAMGRAFTAAGGDPGVAPVAGYGLG